MTDLYATIASADEKTQERLATVLELRAADPQQRAMLVQYSAELELPVGARVLEVGCGTGAVSRYLATLPGVEKVVGVDPSAHFIERARELADGANLEFAVGDGRELAFADGSFDAAVFHTVLCHVPDCELAIGEAFRVLTPGGKLAVFDGDYATITVATYANDPLQACVDAVIASLVHDPWLIRRLIRMLRNAGFEDCQLRGYAYTQTSPADYMLTLIERGADALETDGKLTPPAANALKEEAHARIAAGTFFGHIAYASAVTSRA